MRFYSYVIRSDSGFAPNPFWHYCTLACCKPIIRKNANCGDWVIGTGSSKSVGNNRLVYAMKITEKIDFDEYSKNEKYKCKIPSATPMQRCGDNIYYKDEDGDWKIRDGAYHTEKNIKTDINKGMFVLISDHYYYFGRNAIEIPEKYQSLIKKGPGHKSNFSIEIIEDFVNWLEGKTPMGIHGNPFSFAKD
jgi:hypothetical protein